MDQKNEQPWVMQPPADQHIRAPSEEKPKFIKQRSLSAQKAAPPVVPDEYKLWTWLAEHQPKLTRKLMRTYDRLVFYWLVFQHQRMHCLEVSEPYFVPMVCLLQVACAVAVFCICMFKVDKFFMPSEVGFQHPPGWAELAPGVLTGSRVGSLGRVAWQPAVVPPPHASCLLGLMDNGVCLCSLGIWTGIASLVVSGALYFSLDECCAYENYGMNKAVQAGTAATGAVLWAAVGGVFMNYQGRASMADVALPHWRLAVVGLAFGACGMFVLMGLGVAVSIWNGGWEAPANPMYDPGRMGKLPPDWDPFDLERGRAARLEWRHEFTQFFEAADCDDGREGGSFNSGGRDQSYGSW